MSDSSLTYAVYVEKELVGKRIKSSKVKVLWQLAFASDCIIHQVELRHSIVTGKREIKLDGSSLYQSQAIFQGTFEHSFTLMGHVLRVTVEDTFDGFLYDLLIDGTPFHRCPRKSLAELEAMRKSKADVKVGLKEFTGKNTTLEAKKDEEGDDDDEEAKKKQEKKKKKKEKKEKERAESSGAAAPEVDLLGAAFEATTIQSSTTNASFWDAPISVPKQPASAMMDPFAIPSGPYTSTGYTPAPAASTSASFDPFGSAPSAFPPATSAPAPSMGMYAPMSGPATTQSQMPGSMPLSSMNFTSSYPSAGVNNGFSSTSAFPSSGFGAMPPATSSASTTGFGTATTASSGSKDPFSTDLYNLSDINALPGAKATNTNVNPFGTTNFKSSIPIGQMPSSQPPASSINPFGAPSSMPMGGPAAVPVSQVPYGAPMQQQPQPNYGYPSTQPMGSMPMQQPYGMPPQQQQQQQQPFGAPQSAARPPNAFDPFA